MYGVSGISLYNIVLFLFASPILEEFLFRGLVQNKVNKYIKFCFLHLSLGNITASIIFTFLHFILHNFSLIYLLVIFPSLFFGYLFDKYKGLLFPVLCHSFFNFNIFIAYPLKGFTIFFIDKI